MRVEGLPYGLAIESVFKKLQVGLDTEKQTFAFFKKSSLN